MAAALTPAQIAEMKKKFAEEVKKSTTTKAKMDKSLKQVAALKTAAAKMKIENAKETD